MLLPPSNTSEVLVLYLLCQEAGRKYGSQKTFANIESYIYLKTLMKIVIEQKTAGQFVIKEFIVVVILHMPLKDWFQVFDLCHSPKSNPNFILFLLKVE